MKKLLGLLLAILMGWPVAANAEVLKNVDLKGEIQTIASDAYHQQDNTDYYNHGANTRAMAGLSFNLVEDVRANLMFQYAYNWGYDNVANKGFSSADGMRLVEANVVLSNLFCFLEATVGRQFYGDENSAVMYFGANHYNAEGNNLARALDAVKLYYSDDFKAFTMLAGRIATFEGATRADDESAAVYGADLKLNLTEDFTAQVYGYDARDMRAYDNNGISYTEHVGFYGAKLTLAPEAFLLSAEYARNFEGSRLVKEGHDTGYMVKADFAINGDVVTPRAAFLYAKEGFSAYGNYTPGLLVGHTLGGDIFSYTNDNGVRMFNVGFDVKPAEKWTVSLDGFAFQGRNSSHAATWEGDLTAKYAHNEYVELFAGAGYAKYGNDDSDFSKAVMQHKENVKAQVGMTVKF